MDPRQEARIELIRQVADLREVLRGLGISIVRQDGVELVALCPYHNDHNPSWSINSDPDSDRWGFHSCWSCKDSGGKGDLFGLVMYVRRCRFVDAIAWVENAVGLDGSTTKILDLSLAGRLRDRRRKQKRSGYDTVEKQFQSFPALKQGSAGWRYLESRGLTREQILESKARKGIENYAKRVVLPIFKGLSVVNFYARHIAGGKPKGLNAKGKGLVNEALYNLHKSDPLNATCYLSEGPFDALAIERAGGANSVAVNGGLLLPGQAQLLRRFTRVVIVDDAKGNRSVSLVPSCLRLLQGAELYRVPLPDGHDPASIDLDRLAKLIANPVPLRRSRVRVFVDYSLPK